MAAQRPVTIVNITSPSYAGMTWLCLLLGCHPRVFALGAPDRVWRLRKTGWHDACRVHGTDCPFWPGFHRAYDPERNFYVQLAAASGRDVIAINNPTPQHERAELRHPDLVVRPVRLVRDGRAMAASYSRHRRVDYYDAVVSYVRHIYRDFPFDPHDEDVLAVRYEDLLRDQRCWLERIYRHSGLEITADAADFRTFEHHITSGNAGTIAQVKTPEQSGEPFDGEAWQHEVGQRERFIFDHFCGERNHLWGYEEDAFTSAQRRQFLAELGEARRPWLVLFCDRVLDMRAALGRGARELLGPRLGRRRVLALAAAAWVVTVALVMLLAYFLFT